MNQEISNLLMRQQIERDEAEKRLQMEEDRKRSEALNRSSMSIGAPQQPQQQSQGPSFNPMSMMGAAPAASTGAGSFGAGGMAGGGFAQGGAMGGGFGQGGAAMGSAGGGGMGSALAGAGPYAAMAAAVLAGKTAEYKNPGEWYSDASLSLLGPSFNQMKEDPKLGLMTALGLPFLNGFIASDKAKAAPPEWYGIG
jgi:hypothetical protein